MKINLKEQLRIKDYHENTCYQCKFQGCSMWGFKLGKIDCRFYEKTNNDREQEIK